MNTIYSARIIADACTLIPFLEALGQKMQSDDLVGKTISILNPFSLSKEKGVTKKLYLKIFL
jgi:hypothetical protein